MSELLLILIGLFVLVLVVLYMRRQKVRKPQDPRDINSWLLGPVVQGKNKSIGSRKVPHPDGILAIEVPYRQYDADTGKLSSITFRSGPLLDKQFIRARIRVEGSPLLPAQPGTASATLFIQRRGDNWTADGKYETYRWYAHNSNIVPLRNGEYEMIARLEDNWGATLHSWSHESTDEFIDTLENADRVGIVFGGGDGSAHGLYATGPDSRIVLLDFEIL